MTATKRGHLLWRLGDLIIANVERLAAVEQRDNGKIVSEATAQIRYMGDYFKYYGGLADKVQGTVIPTDKKGVFTYTKHEPKGVVAIITPWNSPLTLTSWKLAPALAAGCTAVIKPSEFTSASMLEFAPLFAEAGFPKGVVNVVTGLGSEVGAALVAHPKVAHVGFTGGDAAGRKIYQLAAAGLKTVTLELGGKSPNIVFDDADLDQAVKGVVSGIFAASGQSCQAGSRLLLQESIHDRFLEKLIAFVRDAKMGDPALRRHPDRADSDPTAVREDPRLHQDREGGGRALRARREEPPRSRRRHVHRADDLHRREERHANRAGRGIRSGARGNPVHRRGRGDLDRQRRRSTDSPRACGRRASIGQCS